MKFPPTCCSLRMRPASAFGLLAISGSWHPRQVGLDPCCENFWTNLRFDVFSRVVFFAWFALQLTACRAKDCHCRPVRQAGSNSFAGCCSKANSRTRKEPKLQLQLVHPACHCVGTCSTPIGAIPHQGYCLLPYRFPQFHVLIHDPGYTVAALLRRK